jgi:glutamate racemase
MVPETPIGFFDSGLGGISVWREVIRLLPFENTVYYADTAFCPYGIRKQKEIIERTDFITDFLLSKHVKLIVVACNTATAAAIDHLRKTYSLPFVGMEPAVKQAALHSKSGVVGVLATQGTFKGKLYHETSERFATNVKIVEQSGDGLVELVETGKTDTPEAIALLKKYIDPMIEAGADHIVLGCTHYPFLLPAIKKITGAKIQLLDPAPAIAQRIKSLLEHDNLLNSSSMKPNYDFFSSGNDADLSNLLNLIVSL